MILKILSNQGATRVKANMEAGVARAQNTLPVMEEIATDMVRIEGIVFSSGGRRGGGQWRRLKPETARKKGSTDILRTHNATEGYSLPGHDALYESLTRRGAPGQILNVTRRGIEFGTNVPAANIQQKGAPRRGIPKRPFIKFLTSDVNRWKAMIAKYLVGV